MTTATTRRKCTEPEPDPGRPGTSGAPQVSPAALARIRADVEALARRPRRTTTEGERESAQWLQTRLTELGASDVRARGFRSQSTWAWSHGVHVLTAMLLARTSGRRARWAAALLAVSYELDVSVRSQWLRRLLPGRQGSTVEGRLPAPGPARRTLVLVAHHDAAHTGVVWSPRAVAASRRRSARTGRAYPSHLVPLLALAGAAIPHRLARRASGVVLGLSAALFAQSAASATTPGANDNATGVAAVLELARRARERSVADLEVLTVFPGGEEAGSAGMRAWLQGPGRALHRDRTLVVNLDAIGSGGHLVVSGREGLTGWLGAESVALAHRGARLAGLAPPPVIALPNVSDGFTARHAGLRTVSILSYEDGWIRHLHTAQDTPENVGWNTVEDAIALVEGIVAAWTAEDPERGA